MIATSHPLAVQAGLRVLGQGGNAADAALAAAAVLCVTEPMSSGLGGDVCALVWQDGELIGLDAAGPAPMSAEPLMPVETRGPRSVTVPGAVAGWAALADRFCRLSLDSCLSDAILLAEEGVVVAPRVAAVWASEDPCPPELGRGRVEVGDRYTLPNLAETLRSLAEHGPEMLYSGPIAEAIAAVSWLDVADLAAYGPRWVKPLSGDYRGYEVHELPPPTQGVVALEALGLLDPLPATLSNQIMSVKLALEDGGAHIRDGAEVSFLLEPEHLDRRRGERPRQAPSIRAGTSYVCAVDADRLAVSLIQSLFFCFGSGVVVPGTGVVLQNRGACFAVNGGVEPGKRPFHTIIPGMLTQSGKLVGPFGAVGGFLQAQAHVQLVSALVDDGLDPQAALDAPRFCVDGELVRLEQGLWERKTELEREGHRVLLDRDTIGFGAGQMIVLRDGALLGGSDPRLDGYAGGV